MTPSPITPGDSLAAVVADLRNPLCFMNDNDATNGKVWAERLERLDAEMRKELDEWRDVLAVAVNGALSGRQLWPNNWSQDQSMLAWILHDTRAKLAACESAAEIRLNDDGSLDEVCAPGLHLEQMNDDHWWMEVGNGLHINLHARGKIKATIIDDRSSRAAPDPGPIHPWDAVGVLRQEEPPR